MMWKSEVTANKFKIVRIHTSGKYAQKCIPTLFN